VFYFQENANKYFSVKNKPMDKSNSDLQLFEINREISTHGMNRKLYEKIASFFMGNMPEHSKVLDDILKHFVVAKDRPIYVNEIRNYLKSYNKGLFREYGNRFTASKGCFEVFGVQPTKEKDYDFRVEKESKKDKAKEYNTKPRNRKKAKNIIKAEAKAKAVATHKTEQEEKLERKKKKEEAYEKLRKQDI